MKKILLLLIVSFSSTALSAQDTYLKWARQFAGTNVLKYGRGMAVATDTNGNVYSVGIFTGTIDFDPGPGIYNLTPISTDVYISKLDSAGKFLWAKQIQGSFGTLTRSFSLDKDLNIYITGTFQATVDFDLGPGVFNLTANGAVDVFVLKLTKDGDLVWVKQIGGPLVDPESYGSVTDAAGNIYFTGNYRGTADFDPGPGTFTLTSTAGFFNDIYICKLDPAGNFVWAGSIGAAEQDLALGISCDKLDNIYVTGFFRTTVDFDPGPGVVNLVSNGQDDMFILKLNAAGNFTWARSIGGTGADYMYKAVVDDAGNIYTTGFFKGTVDFDPGPGIFNLVSSGADAIFVLKLDATGNFVWAKGMGSPGNNNWGYTICLDRLGNVYTTGFFTGAADFDPGPGTFILNASGVDIFFSKLNNAGNFVWAKSAGGSGQDQGLGLTIDRSLNIYATGLFTTTTDFDLEASTYYLTAIPVSDPFVLKLAQCAAPTNTMLNESACYSYTLNGQTYTVSGVYTQTLMNSLGCDSIITLNLVINSRSFSTINAAICTGEDYEGYTISGIYIDTLVAANTCDSIRTLNLTVNSPSFSFIDTSICPGRNYAGYTSTGIYIDTLIAANDCDSVRTIDLTVKNNCGVYIPNSFTPNNNSLNDLFKPVISIPFGQYSFVIYNRYGQKVFETRDYTKGWDGTFKGKEQQAGTYVYRITYTNMSGWETAENGTVLLIR